MLEKERDWKRVVRILAGGGRTGEVIWCLGGRVGSALRDEMIDASSRD
jgi:hypothetical protein